MPSRAEEREQKLWAELGITREKARERKRESGGWKLK